MKKLLIGVFALGLFGYIGLATLAGAQGVPDLGVENVGLLPSNPFYFLKEFGRGVRHFFIGNAIRKAEFELSVVNEKAAELKKLEEIAPYNIGGLTGSVENYLEAVESLKSRLEDLGANTDNERVAELVNNLIDRVLRHQKLINDLRSQFSREDELVVSLDSAIDSVVDLLSVIPGNLDEPVKFKERFENLVAQQSDDYRDLRSAELADRLEEKLSGDARKAVAALREDLLINFSGRLEGADSAEAAAANIGSLPGDRLRVLRLLDEVREMTGDSDLRSALNVVRQGILDKADEEKSIGEDAVSEAIEAAKMLIGEVETKIGEREGAVRASVTELLNRARFHLDQAVKFYEGENYGAAYGQATAAYAAAKNAWTQLIPSVFDHSQTLEYLKKVYDNLLAKATDAGLDKESNPKIYELLSDAEKRIVGLGQLLEKGGKPEAIATALKNIKLLLATIEEMIRAALNPAAEEAPVLRVQMLAPAATIGSDQIQESVTVVISEKGFSPELIQIKKGTRVNWFNKDIAPHWPASDPYPTNHLLPDFNAKNGLSQGEVYSYVFDKPGVWKYHDDLNRGLTGVVEVTE